MFRPNTPPPPMHRGWVAALLLVALSIRLAWSLSRPVDEEAMVRSLPDQREYLQLGRNLIGGKGLGFVDLRFNDEVRAFRPAGYPLLVALCGGNVQVIRGAQAFIDTSTVLAILLLARRWLGDRASFFAGWIVALNPFLIFFTSLVLTETLFTAMIAWGLASIAYAGAIHLRRTRRAVLWWGGLALLALSIQVRPSAIGLVIVAGIAAMFTAPRATGSSRLLSVPVATSLLLMTIISLLPWAIRNRIVLKEWVWTSTNDGFTLYDGWNPSADGSSDQSFVAALPQLRTMDEVGRSSYLANAAWNWALENPRRVMQLAAVKLGRMWSPIPLSAEFGGRRLYVFAAAAYSIPFFTLVLLGLWRGALPRAAKIYLLVPAIYLGMVHAMTIGSLRYRIPAEPPLAVLAAAALTRKLDPRTYSE